MNIKLVHLLTNPDDEREVRSVASVSGLDQFGFHRIQIVNPLWSEELPEARYCAERWFTLTKAHYGCWKAHRDAIAEHLVDTDALLICEGDCLFVEPPETVAIRIERALVACKTGNLTAFTFGYRHNGQTIDRVDRDVIVITQWIGSECYLVPMESREIFMELFAQPWDAYDICLTHRLIDVQKRRIGTFADRPVSVQANGRSLISGLMHSHENHFRHLRYKE